MNERIEWTRVWREEADKEIKRVLLIGDSIINGSQKWIQASLPEGYAITSVVSSKGVDDPFWFREIQLVCEQEDFKYEAAYFNNGLHFHDQTAEQYQENYRKMLKKLQEMLPGVPFILGLSTPLTDSSGDPGKHDAPVTLKETNATVLAFNQKVVELAAEMQLTCFDAYSLMVTRPELKKDSCHFVDEGNRILGRAIAEAITQKL